MRVSSGIIVSIVYGPSDWAIGHNYKVAGHTRASPAWAESGAQHYTFALRGTPNRTPSETWNSGLYAPAALIYPMYKTGIHKNIGTSVIHLVLVHVCVFGSA